MTIGFDGRLMSVPGGIPRYCKELLTNLIEEFPDLNFVIIVKEIPKDFPKNSRIRWITTNIHWYTLREQIELGHIMNAQTEVDLWHIPHWNVPITLRKPFVMTFHDFIFEQFPTHNNNPFRYLLYYTKLIAWRILMHITTRRAKKIITVSQYVRNELIKRYPNVLDRTQTVYVGLSKLPPGEAPDTPINKPFFLVVGNSYPHKNHELIFKTVLENPRLTPEWYIITHRDRFSEKNEEKTRMLGIDKKIHFLFDASDTTLAWCYEHMSALVFPSRSEGFGIPPLEAFSYGKPAIVAKTTSLPEILGDGLARWINPDSTKDLASVIQDISKNDSGESSEIISKRIVHAKKYNWKETALSTQKIYQSVL